MESASPTLAGMPPEVQENILRMLMVSENPIELDPFSPAAPDTIPAGNMSMARVSKHFSQLALRIFYGDNCFALVLTENPDPPPVDARWLTLFNQYVYPHEPPDLELSMGCLNLLDENVACRRHLHHLQWHLGQCGITVFYANELICRIPYSTPTLKTLRFVLEPGWELVLEPDFGRGFMKEGEKEKLYPDFAAGFLAVVHEFYEDLLDVSVVERHKSHAAAHVKRLQRLLEKRNRNRRRRPTPRGRT